VSGHRIQLMLDSGAYSAWKQQKKKKAPEPLDLDEYIEFIKRNQQWISHYVNLDVIPGSRTRDEVRASAKQSYRNAVLMKRAGLNPMPVFHWGERFSWLNYMLDDGHDYIGVSAPKHGPIKRRLRWLDRAFSVIRDKGRPRVKVHGFGITSPELLLRYNFHSVDSTTWAKSAGYGKILVPPRGADGLPDYGRPAEGVIMSGRRQGNKSQNARRFEVLEILDPARRDRAEEYLASFGISIPNARQEPAARRGMLVSYYQELAKRLPLTIFYATSINNSEFARQLGECGVTTQLLSFSELRKMKHPDDVLRSYVENHLHQVQCAGSPAQVRP
jgi:hypothetical protein